MISDEEARMAVHPSDAHDSLVPDHHQGDDKAIAVPDTADMSPLDEPFDEQIQAAVNDMSREDDDWLHQYNALLTVRRAVVHHRSSLTNIQTAIVLPCLKSMCDNLRSAVAKCALLALGEWFASSACNDHAMDEATLAGILEVLLRRAVCEKRFLRETAVQTINEMTKSAPSIALMENAAKFSNNRSPKVCAIAAKVVTSTLRHVVEDGSQSLASADKRGRLSFIVSALGKFYTGKEAATRSEAIASFKVLRTAFLSKDDWESLVMQELGSHVGSKVLRDVNGSCSRGASSIRRGSLRNRMLQDAVC